MLRLQDVGLAKILVTAETESKPVDFDPFPGMIGAFGCECCGRIFVRRRTLRSADHGAAEEIQRVRFARLSRSFVDDCEGFIKALGGQVRSSMRASHQSGGA